MKEENFVADVQEEAVQTNNEAETESNTKTNTTQEYDVNLFFDSLNLVGDKVKVKNVIIECEDEIRVILTRANQKTGIVVLNQGIVDYALIGQIIFAIKTTAAKYEISVEELANE